MEDKFVRYSKLYLIIFLLFLLVPVSLAICGGFFYGVSKIIASELADVTFELIVSSLPVAIFSTTAVIFFIRTKHHPSPVIKAISKIVFAAIIIFDLAMLVLDIRMFFTGRDNNIVDYKSFSLLFLAGNIGSLFLIAIIQAFTTKKEKDWMERN